MVWDGEMVVGKKMSNKQIKVYQLHITNDSPSPPIMASRLVRGAWNGLSFDHQANLIFGVGYAAIGFPATYVVARSEIEAGTSVPKNVVRSTLFGMAWPMIYPVVFVLWVVQD